MTPTDRESRELRACLGRFATGITIVTCVTNDGTPRGITANSFSSVSLAPPLVLWNVDKEAEFLHDWLGARHFAINVLGSGQRPLAEHFAAAASGFNGIDHALSVRGVPLLAGTTACLECRTWRVSECGDHFIIVGEVTEHRCGDGEPLLYFRGRYAQLK